MNYRFARGLVVGSLIGASLGFIMNDNKSIKSRRRMMKQGRTFIKRSGNILNNVVEMLK